jgi:YHS domain-containing protein
LGIVLLVAALSLAAAALTPAQEVAPSAPAIRTEPPATTSGSSGMALLNLDNTVALHGYDPVAYFTQNRARRGSKAIKERLGSATYYFASRAHRYTFLKDAPRYQPQVGGFCVTSMSMGRLEDVDPEKFLIFEGKLYLFRDDEAQARFLNNPRRIIAEATSQYFRMAQRQRSYY